MTGGKGTFTDAESIRERTRIARIVEGMTILPDEDAEDDEGDEDE